MGNVSSEGVDFQVCNMKVDKQVVALQLWDTAGQERFRSLSKQYFRKADGVIMMYDVTNQQSFFNVRSWMEDVQNSVEPGTSLMLLGSKKDLVSINGDVGTYIYPGEARRLAFEYNASFFETSSVTGLNIDECMKYMSRLLRDREDQTIAKTINVLSSENEHGSTGAFKNSCSCGTTS
ncbi:hypothetical protein HELRODRAFT_171558 [Helobdella robusta]|uniref:Uncharacterized protein n=1 Tax=Helobdella robusta TaxID=6412 RepID=T1F4E7_HELRO|nr:hypothetical protein HELRODRAFT_171558 [Helobdella robusta]ESO05211.1 hypothetical protein HELRODRAFT_171558 [Helobdella robusta]